MTKLTGLLVAAALCAVVAPASAQQQQAAPNAQLRAQRAQQYQQAPPIAEPAPQPAPAADQPVTTSTVFPANQVWAPAAENLRSGGRLQITAQGQWTMRGQQANLRAAQVAPQFTGPDGYPGLTNERALLPSANIGALIGKIGENGAPFLIGANYDQPIAADGPLLVAMNDIVDQQQDNQGRMSIQVIVSPPPAPEPPPEAQTPQVETTTTVSPDAPVTPAAPVSPLVQYAIVGAAILAGLLLLGSFFRPRTNARDQEKHAATAAQVATRVVSDGVERQLLQLNVKAR